MATNAKVSALQPLDAMIATRLHQHQQDPEWLRGLREHARATLAAVGLPGKRWESWHYSACDTWLQQFDEQHGLTPLSAGDTDAATPLAGASTLHVSHGHLVGCDIAAADRDALAVLPLAELDPANHGALIDWLGAHPHADSLGAVATALAPQSWVLIVRAGQRLTQPVVVAHRTTQRGAQLGQLIVWLESGAEALVMETFDGVPVASLQIAHTQLQVQDGARLTYVRLHRDAAGSQHLGVIEGDIQRDAQLRVQLLRGGAAPEGADQRQRDGLYLRLQQPGAEAVVRGAFAAAGSQHIDYHLTVDHLADHGRCDLRVQGLAGDRSRGVVNGRIQIAAGTRANDGQFTSHNLLSSDQAEIDTKPELEIYADEVRCNHGATVGQLDEDQLLYLRSRGIDRDQAIALLTESFLKAGLLDTGRDDVDAFLQQQLLASIGGAAS